MHFFGNEKYYLDGKDVMHETSLIIMISCAFSLVGCALGQEREGPSSKSSKILVT